MSREVPSSEVEEWNSFGFVLLKELSTVLGWGAQHMDGGFVHPGSPQQRDSSLISRSEEEALRLWEDGDLAAVRGDLNGAYAKYEV